jgi:DnaJ-class molecular chaperone
MSDPYKTLGLQRGAGPDEIRAAYRRLARVHHPDVSKSPDAARQFSALADAYQRLTDPKFKSRIDLSTPPPPPAPDMTEVIDEAAAAEVYDAFFNPSARSAPRRPRPPYEPIPGTPDLLLRLPISVLEAAVGTVIPVPTPTGAADLTIPPGTRTGQRFTLTARGSPRPGGKRGDLIVEAVVIPGSGTDAEGYSG